MTHVTTRELGQTAETRALEYLQARGLRLLARNWRCRCGELDLVMLEGDTVVFAEVRSRASSAWGGAAASVDARKREKLIKTAHYFLQQERRWSNNPCRFDVIALGGGAAAPVEWIRSAFEC